MELADLNPPSSELLKNASKWKQLKLNYIYNKFSSFPDVN